MAEASAAREAESAAWWHDPKGAEDVGSRLSPT